MREERDRFAEKHKEGEKDFIVTNWEVETMGSRAEVILGGRAQCTQALCFIRSVS